MSNNNGNGFLTTSTHSEVEAPLFLEKNACPSTANNNNNNKNACQRPRRARTACWVLSALMLVAAALTAGYFIGLSKGQNSSATTSNNKEAAAFNAVVPATTTPCTTTTTAAANSTVTTPPTMNNTNTNINLTMYCQDKDCKIPMNPQSNGTNPLTTFVAPTSTWVGCVGDDCNLYANSAFVASQSGFVGVVAAVAGVAALFF